MEHQLVHLLNALSGDEFHFEICCLQSTGVNAELLDPRVGVHVLNKPERFDLKAVAQIRRLLNQGFDLLHTHNLGSLIYASLASFGGISPPILHGEHSQLAPDELLLRKKLQRWLLFKTCRAVHTVSNSQCGELREVGLTHPQLVPIVNGVNCDRYRPLANHAQREPLRKKHDLWDNDAFIIAIVARFGEFKRHLDLLEAMELLWPTHPRLKLLVVGDGGPMKETVLTRMQSSRYAHNTRWIGYTNSLPDLLPSIDLLAIPSANEGLSNVTLESLACGVPVISNRNASSLEILKEGAGGWIEDLSSPTVLAEMIANATKLTPSELAQKGLEGRHRVESAFSMSLMHDSYRKWFSACAKRTAH